MKKKLIILTIGAITYFLPMWVFYHFYHSANIAGLWGAFGIFIAISVVIYLNDF